MMIYVVETTSDEDKNRAQQRFRVVGADNALEAIEAPDIPRFGSPYMPEPGVITKYSVIAIRTTHTAAGCWNVLIEYGPEPGSLVS